MTILSIGEPLVEFNASSDGSLAAAEEFRLGYGGDSSNFLIAVRRSGADAGYVTRIGDDAFGDVLVGLWEREGVDTRHVTREPGGRTGIYFIARAEDGASFTYYRSDSPASRLTTRDVPDAAVAEADALHATGITQAISTSSADAAFHAMDLARRHGTLVSYDPNHRPALWPTERARAVVMRSLELCDIALPNLEEGRVLTALDEPEKVLKAFAERGPDVVVLKLGGAGALLSDHGRVHRVAPHPVSAVDPSGAGDTFDGAFLAELLRGAAPVSAARYAAVAAALTTTDFGAVRPIPNERDVRARLRDGAE